jgi:transposase
MESNPKREQARKRRRFTREFKNGAVRLVLEEGKSVHDVGRDLDVHPTVIGSWVKQAKIDRGRGPAGALTEVDPIDWTRPGTF